MEDEGFLIESRIVTGFRGAAAWAAAPFCVGYYRLSFTGNIL